MVSPQKLLIYSIVYNEEAHIVEMLQSLLAQEDTEFDLLISDNHSTDRTVDLIREHGAAINRLRLISPPQHLSGIEHGHFVHRYICDHYSDTTHVMFLGGHDIVSPNYVHRLKSTALENVASAIVYTDTYRLSSSGEVLEHYPNSVNTSGVSAEFIPFVLLLGIGHNIMSSGLWKMEAFRCSEPRFICCAADHLVLCEAALLGAVSYCPGAALYLRDAATYREGWSYYVEKHIPKKQREKGCEYDFAQQVRWLIAILERSSGVSAERAIEMPIASNYFLSGIQLYLLRYMGAAQGFLDGGSFSLRPLYLHVQRNDFNAVLRRIGELVD